MKEDRTNASFDRRNDEEEQNNDNGASRNGGAPPDKGVNGHPNSNIEAQKVNIKPEQISTLDHATKQYEPVTAHERAEIDTKPIEIETHKANSEHYRELAEKTRKHPYTQDDVNDTNPFLKFLILLLLSIGIIAMPTSSFISSAFLLKENTFDAEDWWRSAAMAMIVFFGIFFLKWSVSLWEEQKVLIHKGIFLVGAASLAVFLGNLAIQYGYVMDENAIPTAVSMFSTDDGKTYIRTLYASLFFTEIATGFAFTAMFEKRCKPSTFQWIKKRDKDAAELEEKAQKEAQLADQKTQRLAYIHEKIKKEAQMEKFIKDITKSTLES